MITMCSWVYAELAGADSGPPYELLITVAPRAAAVFSAAARLAPLEEFASTIRIEQYGQIAETMSMSSAVSSPHCAFSFGSVAVPV